jgi:hypothetical protein
MIRTHKYRKHTSKTKKSTRKNVTNAVKKTLLDEVSLGKQLGKGMGGTVFLAHDKNGNNYAYKIERILPKDVPQSLKSPYWRENDFAEAVANKYPDHFMVLYDSKIEDNCKHRQDFSGMNVDMKNLPKSKQKYYKDVNKSPYCSVKLWSIVDGVIGDLLQNKPMLSKKVFYDLFIQMLYIVYLMNNAGYVHNDFHLHNIGYTKTDRKTVNILGHNIPTHGYLIKVIDYGVVQNGKYPLTKKERIAYDNRYDLFFLFLMCSIEMKTEKIAGKKWDWKEEWYKHISLTPIKISELEQKKLEKYLPEGKKLSDDNHDFLIHTLYKLTEWKKWQQQILDDTTIEGKEPTYLIPLNNMLFLVKNLYNPKHILEYFIRKRHV